MYVYIYRKLREYWWNVSIKIATKVSHKKPDLIMWSYETKVKSLYDCRI